MSATAVNAAYHTAIWRRAAVDERYAALRQVEGRVTAGMALAVPA
ncbi:MAG: hypothetical protein U0031_13715 [Thermomicrobiales bacterium]